MINQKDNLFVQLPLLEDVVRRVRKARGNIFEDTAILCVQHLLETTGSLLESIIALGASPSQIFVLGKSYSMNRSVFQRLVSLGINVKVNRSEGRLIGFSEVFDAYVDRLWLDLNAQMQKSGISKVLVLDDGGHCISRIHPDIRQKFHIMGVEQTTSGIKRIGVPPFPVIDVALSAAKTLIEAPLISETVMQKVNKYLPKHSIRAAVLGVGNIGRAILKMLIQRRDQVCVFDIHQFNPPEAVKVCKTITELMGNADYIFGCTGEDALGAEWIHSVSGEKWLMSCSSEDREFRSILDYAHQHRLVAANGSATELMFNAKDTKIHILRGGYPVNFDRRRESVPARQIQVTRALLLAGLIQAASASTSATEYLMLDPFIQRFVVQNWLEHEPDVRNRYSAELLVNIGDIDWVAAHSKGHLTDSSALRHIFQPCGQDMFAASV